MEDALCAQLGATLCTISTNGRTTHTLANAAQKFRGLTEGGRWFITETNHLHRKMKRISKRFTASSLPHRTVLKTELRSGIYLVQKLDKSYQDLVCWNSVHDWFDPVKRAHIAPNTLCVGMAKKMQHHCTLVQFKFTHLYRKSQSALPAYD